MGKHEKQWCCVVCGVLCCIVMMCDLSDMCGVSALALYISQPIMGLGRGTGVGMDVTSEGNERKQWMADTFPLKL